ncbi:hypothetical protein PTSG_00262 [Salpingoeca rosetta]|uniref:Uncharacterized protein n=1 Tax=Salpingoeca rosetta (strain ATCC 50818 / BSB-021) TaxID=946362 RepID=F2TVZ5_SALR5|nr:uncharacterized protein PTSG_00262 [Salpingoeca rosetta]EGD72241.1 hypothetical protein PTSG_00262 [Salpingoeca rosetta]|eukprot:XP_004998812.1 hypothetical protein PTSG_00262 [Salpingoeca rosetta]
MSTMFGAVARRVTAAVAGRRVPSTLVAVAVRNMTAGGTHGPTLTVEMAADIQATHTTNLKNDFMMYAKQLADIKERKTDPFHKRWQDTMNVFMTSQLHTLLLYGYTPDENGMREFTMAFDQLSRSDSSGEGVTDMQAKQEAIMAAVVPLQMEAAAASGFTGDDGFLKMQCLMMAHSSDEQISYNTLSGLLPVYRRAGISLQQQQEQQ